MNMSRIEAGTLNYHPGSFELPNGETLNRSAEYLSNITVGAKKGFLRGANRFLNRNLFKKIDASLTTNLQKTLATHYQRSLTKDDFGNIRVSEESQSIMLSIQAIGTEIDAAKNKIGLLSKTEIARLELLAQRLARLNRDLSVDSRTDLVVNRLGMILRDPAPKISTVDQMTGGTSPITRVMPPTIPTPSGPTSPIPPGRSPRRPSLTSRLAQAKTRFSSYSDKKKVAVLAGGAWAVTGLAALGVGGAYLAYKHWNPTTETIAKGPSLKASDFKIQAEKPTGMSEATAGQWVDRIKGAELNKMAAYQPKESVKLSVEGKSQSLAVDIIVSSDPIFNNIMNRQDVPGIVKRGLRKMRPETGPRQAFDYKDPEQFAVFQMLTTGVNIDDEGNTRILFNTEYGFIKKALMANTVDQTWKKANISRSSDDQNPLEAIKDSSDNTIDFTYDSTKGPLIIPSGAVINPTDPGYYEINL